MLLFKIFNDGVAFKGMPVRVFKSESTGFEIIDYNIGNATPENGYMGDYSWGRVDISSRTGTKEFEIYNNGLSGITTSPIVRRVNPLKSSQYLL